MAHSFWLSKGATTVSLEDTNKMTLRYRPVTPPQSAIDYYSSLVDGGERVRVTRRNVTEEFEFLIKDTSVSDLVAKKVAIEQMLLDAERYQNTGVGDKVYWNVQLDGSSAVRSEVLSGDIEFDTDALHTQWLSKAVHFKMTLRRRFYFEGSRTELSLTNGHGSGTGGVTIYNCDDGNEDDYVTIASSSILGVLPCPLEIRLYNSYNESVRAGQVYIGAYSENTPASTYPPIHIEGENFTTVMTSTTPSDSDCSNGAYRNFSLTDTSDHVLMYKEFTASELKAFGGKYYHVILRFSNLVPYNTQFKALLAVSGTFYLQDTGWVTCNGVEELMSVNALRIPPFIPGSGDVYPLRLYIWARQTVTQTGTVPIDYVKLLPTDGFKKLFSTAYGSAYATTLVSDDIEGITYVEWGSSGRIGNFVDVGNPILVLPGYDHKISFQILDNDGGASVHRSSTVRIYYRPRYLTP